VTVGLAGADAAVLRCGIDAAREVNQPARGWSDDDWLTAAARLVGSDLLHEDGRATDAGRAQLAEAEAITDRIAAPPWQTLPPADLTALARRLVGPARACRELIPEVTPIGTLRIWDVDADPEFRSWSGS
jgi:hypothetical protein